MPEKNSNTAQSEKAKRKRGQQAGRAGHGRRDYGDLLTTEKVVSLSKASSNFPCCDLPYQELAGYESSL